jgi:hypothetical protein
MVTDQVRFRSARVMPPAARIRSTAGRSCCCTNAISGCTYRNGRIGWYRGIGRCGKPQRVGEKYKQSDPAWRKNRCQFRDRPRSPASKLTAGIDIGSITTKVAVLDGRNILGTDLGFTGYNPDKSWREVYTRTLERLEEYVDYVEAQLWDLIALLERHNGKRFDAKKFIETVNRSRELSRMFMELREYRKRFPANSYFEWVRLLMLPMVCQWNEKAAVRFYGSELGKARERFGGNSTIESGREKFRVAWDGITLWYKVDLSR